MIDHWEVDGDLLTKEEELGEGAFGKVYKGALKQLTTPSQKLFFKSTMKTARNTTIKGNEMFTVAVKILHGEYNTFIFCKTYIFRHSTYKT